MTSCLSECTLAFPNTRICPKHLTGPSGKSIAHGCGTDAALGTQRVPDALNRRSPLQGLRTIAGCCANLVDGPLTTDAQCSRQSQHLTERQPSGFVWLHQRSRVKEQ